MPALTTLPLLSELPAAYAVERSRHAFAAVHESVREGMRAIGWSATGAPALRSSGLQGRRPLFELETPDEVLLVRRFSHGGLLRWATGERFRDPERPFREVLLSEHLLEHGILTPRVVAARARRASTLPGWYLEVLTRRVPDTSDLGLQLAHAQRGELGRPERPVLLSALGQLVARLHACGFLHADLNPNNVLVELPSLARGAPRLWILDLDRSRLGPITERERWDNLGRLFRHVDRRESERGRTLSRTDLWRVLAGYAATGADRKRAWRAIEAGRRSQGWHRLGWMLERRFGGGDPRSGS